MATFLSALGRFSFRRRWYVTVLWTGLLVLAGVLAAQAPAAPQTDFAMPGTEAQRAYDVLHERFPAQNANGATARVVFKSDGGRVTEPQTKEAIGRTVQELGKDPQVSQVADPFVTHSVSKDGSTAYAQVTYEVSSPEVEEDSRTALMDTVERARSSTLTVEVGGNALSASEGSHASEAIGLAVAAVVLVITFGALLAAGLPLFTAMLGVGIGMSVIKALSSALGLGSTTSVLATMLGLAVGIDYALFVVSRYRAELAEGRDREEAAGRALGTAGSAVVFAGLTVVIALVGLAVVNIPVLTQMGLAAAGTVALAVLIAVTLVPALLGIAGRRIRPAGPRRGKLFTKTPDAKTSDAKSPDAKSPDEGAVPRPGMGVRWARFVTRRPLAVLLVGVAALLTVAVPAASLELGLPDDGSQPTSTTQRRAYDLLSKEFGPGFNGPLMVVAQPEGGGSAKTAAESATARIQRMDDVARVNPPRLNNSDDTAVLTVVPATAPSSLETTDLVHALRDPGLEADSGAQIMVSGSTAMNIDVSQKLTDALVPYLALVAGLALLLLIAVFRSLLVPLKAALGFVLSITAALGVVVAVFQWGWGASLFGVSDPGPVVSLTPIFMVGVVFGLAMDYEVFLVTRMREAYVSGQSPLNAISSGFEFGGRVVTAAAIIMISVFAAFMGSDELMVKTIGFGLATAVFLDAFIVRMTLVPAVLALLGHRAWWLPRRLDRWVPDIDVEGAKLGAPERNEPDEAVRASTAPAGLGS
ncbi:MMPL family transporter [Streptomyces coffeae]|uniref:MMPL family transporter n=1 Tax=Streptomyces coffeae TaxID=621382 RepID=A0ABS1NJY2_9ACTN|nr:MMPL family transporter [Streptomyces coffeae]MBL1100329.1 MMPL family transporter [Streptomyces coffeae]